jgi:hypothetical protein
MPSRVAAALAKLADSPAPTSHAATASEGATSLDTQITVHYAVNR